MANASEQYFTSEPGVASAPSTVTLTLPDLQLRLSTDRGVFAREGIDPGTKYLLLEAPMPPANFAGTIVDVGCGYGPIALCLARRFPHATVWAIETNHRAQALCTANADATGASNVIVAGPDGAPAELVVDYLFSNPPIRIGKAALHALLEQWLGRLSPQGCATLVVHKHLGSDSLARWLQGEGYQVSRVGSRMGYRLLEVRPAP